MEWDGLVVLEEMLKAYVERNLGLICLREHQGFRFLPLM